MFGYGDLLHEVQLLCRNGVETGVVGESQKGRRIPYIFVGKKNGNRMIVQGAIHAREHLTALLLVDMAKYLVKNSPKMLGGIYFVPMVNPDGVELCQRGAGIFDKQTKSNLLAINGGADFSLWKANADGVDLNVNFDANWGEGEQNAFCRAPQNYVGKSPLCAAESRALVRFTQMLRPLVTLSYHLKGEEIYWQFHQTGHRRCRDRRYAAAIAATTGYKVSDAFSAGGYKDWCVQTLKIPAFTVEVGSDRFSHPFPYSQYEDVYRRNVDVPRRLLNTVCRDDAELRRAGLAYLMQ